MPIDHWITAYESRGASRMASEIDRLATSYGRLESSAQRTQRIGTIMTTAGAVGIAAMAKLGQVSVREAARVEATRVGFASLLGSQEKARKLYSDIEKFSLISPLNNAETAKGAQLLLVTGTRQDDVMRKMHAIGNATSAAGGGQDRFNGVLQAMAKLENRSIASRQQLNQIALRGVPVNKILQKELGLTADQVADIGRQGLKGVQVAEALYRGMDKIAGGKAMENLNKTYLGQVSQLEDATQQLEASVGEIVLPDATRFVGGLAHIASYMRDISRAHPGLTRVFLGIGAGGAIALVAAGQVLKWRSIILQGRAAAKMLADANKAAAVAQNVETAAEMRKLPVGAAEIIMHQKAAAATLEHAAANAALGMGGGGVPMLPAGPGLPALPAAGGATTGAATTAVTEAAEEIGEAVALSFGGKVGGAMGRAWMGLRALVNKPLVGSQNYAAMMEDINMAASPMGRFWLRTSVGNGLAAGAVGAGVGYGVYDSLSNDKNQAAIRSYTGVQLGEGGAMGISAGLGIAAGALALAFPPATAAIIAFTAAAKAAEFAANKLYNEPAEKKAETGNGLDNTAVYGKGAEAAFNAATAQAAKTRRPEDYDKVLALLAEREQKAQVAGDDEAAQAAGHLAMAYHALRAKSLQPGTAEYDIRQYTASTNATSEANKEEKIRAFTEARMRPGAGAVYPTSGGWRDPELEAEMRENQRQFAGRADARQMRAYQEARMNDAPQVRAAVGAEQRSGGNKIQIEVTLPDRYSDQQARRRRSNTMTPAPV